MTIIEDEAQAQALDILESSLLGVASDVPAGGEAGPEEEPEKQVRTSMVAGAAALTCLGGAWMATRIFRGMVAAPAVAVIGVAIGVGIVFLSYKLGKGGLLQYAVAPAAVVVGALLATTGEVAGRSLPSTIVDAFRGGGLLQPPIPFDPGWRFLLVVLFAFLGAAATATAVSMARPKLAVAIPMPVVIGAALIQPKGSEIVASAVAIVFVVAGLALAYGADLAAEGVSGGGFEARRLVRGGGLLAVAVVGLVVISQTNFLFPATDKNQVVPPQKPPPPSPEADRPLFRTHSDRPGPWRMGVLDVYNAKDNSFYLPSIDPKRMVKVPKTGVVQPVAAGRPTYTATFTIDDVKGQTLPSSPDPSAMKGLNKKAEFDPRTQVFKLVETSLPHGLTYSVVAPVPPTSKEMAAAPPPPAAIASEFLAMPPAPPGVKELLARAPTGNQFERLQFVRQALYEKVVASGAGKPGDMPPSKVDEMLRGGPASPFEINAAEVMLSRWAGIPARLGFGFYGGDKTGDSVTFRPRHGAAWLESYFEGYGWVPVLGTPPKAKPSLVNQPKNHDPRIVATDELALTVFVPVRLESIQMIYEIVRWYVAVFGPILLALLFLWLSYPAGLKWLRSNRRRRWAVAVGAPARVVVAYAELRDRLNDLNIGTPRSTPVEFLDNVADDDEHGELAWLVTRALWGDLRRDLRVEDVEAAEEMARSVTRRVLREQSALNRFLAATSRASLKDPWTDEVPNLWRARKRAAARRGIRSLVPRRLRWRRRVAAAAATTVVALVLGACGGTARVTAPSTYPSPLMPAAIGPYGVTREQKVESEFTRPGRRALVSGGQVYTVRDADAIQGSVEVAVFKPGVDAQREHVQEGIERGLGTSAGFRIVHYGITEVRVLQTPEQQVFLWFPPERNAMELFIMRNKFTDAEKVVQAIIAHQRGLDLKQVWS